MDIRVEFNALQQKREHFFFRGILFSGFAYKHKDNYLECVYTIKEGGIIDSNSYGFFKVEDGLKIDMLLLEDAGYDYDNDVPCVFNGKIVNGVAYEYKNGFCYAEHRFVAGILVESIWWRFDGSGLIQGYDWIDYTDDYKAKIQYLNEDGIKKHSLLLDHWGEGERERLEVCLDYKNEITRFRFLTDGHFDELNQLTVRADLGLPYKNAKELMGSYEFSDASFVMIEDEVVFNALFEKRSFKKIKRLKIFGKKLSLESLNNLVSLKDLELFAFEESEKDFIASDFPEEMRDEARQRHLVNRENRKSELITFFNYMSKTLPYCDFYGVYKNSDDQDILLQYQHPKSSINLIAEVNKL